MKTKWGNKNTELTITGDKTSDANFLFIIEKMVCDRNYLDSLNGCLVATVRQKLNPAHDDMARLKRKTFWSCLKRIFMARK